jgi:hypothetical protein
MHTVYDQPGPVLGKMLTIVLFVGILAIIVGTGVLWYQVLHWLQFGEWRSLVLGDLWIWIKGQPLTPRFSWLGAQKIAELILEMSMPLGVAIVGAALIFGSTRVGVLFCALLFPTIGTILLISYLVGHLFF